MANVLKTFTDGEKITAEETNSNNRYLENLNTATAQELQAYLEQEIERLENSISGAIYQPGDLKLLPHNKTLSGFLLCDGSSLLREDYPDLFTAIGTIYGAIDDYHFNLPDFQGMYLRGYGGNSATLGTKQTSAAPNITGGFTGGTTYSGGDVVSGAFTRGGTTGAVDPGNGRTYTNRNYSFSASASSSIYKDGVTEIRTDNYAVNIWIKY